MVLENRPGENLDQADRAMIFLEKEVLMEEFHTTSIPARPWSISEEFVSALRELQNHFVLAIAKAAGKESVSIDKLLDSIKREFGILISSSLKEDSIPADRRYLMHPGLRLTFYPERPDDGTGSFLSGALTICFHTYADMTSWIMSHPNPYRNLLDSLHAGAQAIKRGELVAFPTETVYGLGADATDPNAVEKIFKAKQRPFYDPLIVHVADREQMLQLVTSLPEKAERLIACFWPGPLTIVLPKSSIVPAIVTAGSPSVAVRMPSNPIALELIRLSGKPIAAPSANRFGCTSPTTAKHVQEQLGGTYDVMIDGGACIVGIESTVISFLGDTPRILRPGGIDQQAIESCIGKVLSEQKDSPDESTTSPGMLPSHYATATPLRIVEDVSVYAGRGDVGVLLFGKNDLVFAGPVEYLSLLSDPAEAAKRLYQAMRKLDSLSLSLLVVELLPENGIGIAINNRLKKAANNATHVSAL
jgi:L-threonylcarbamoyladenylate synthase